MFSHLHNCSRSPMELQAGCRPCLQFCSHQLESTFCPRPAFVTPQDISSKVWRNLEYFQKQIEFVFSLAFSLHPKSD